MGAQLARADEASPPDTAEVTIAPSDGGAPRSLALAGLADRFDVHDAAYTVRAADGATSTVTVADGISLAALLAAAGLDADVFGYIELSKADGSSAIVLRDDLGGTDEGPPVVWSDADGVHFLRPSGGEADANGADLVTLAADPLSIALKAGEPLVPRIAVSALRVHPRERVDFSASLVGGAALGAGRDYQWYFDGTGTVRGANVSHRFPRPGTYLVLLNVVRGDGTSLGDPDTVNVRVARAQRPADDAHRSGDGGSGGGGGSAVAGSGGSVPGGGDGAATSGDAAPAPAGDAPAPSVAPPASPPPPAPVPPARPAPQHAPAASVRPQGPLVSGTLIAAADAAAAPANAGSATATAARKAASDGPLRVPIGAWVAIGLAALLALGWALESRHTLPFWQP